jgi:hypothetical protein
MEAFGIALALLGGVFAAPLFCFGLVKLVRPFAPLAALGFGISLTAVALFCVELLLVSAWGIPETRRHLGPGFFPVHGLLTLALAPACACVLLLGKRSLARWWPVAAVICWFVGAGAIFYQYDVAETLYGIGGIGGTYQWPG